MIFCRRSRAGFSCFCLPHFFSKEDSAFAGGGPRGSALGLEDDSDGKPCSGVRGGQQASTASKGDVSFLGVLSSAVPGRFPETKRSVPS